MRQRESVWPEENRGKCRGIAALAGGGAQGRGSRRFSGAPDGAFGARLEASWCEGRHSLVRGVTLVVRDSTLAGAGPDACCCEGDTRWRQGRGLRLLSAGV